MKKAVLSNRIWMNYDENLYNDLKLELSYIIANKIPGGEPIHICLVSTIKKDYITIPIGCTYLIPDDYEIVDKRVYVPTKFPKFKFKLRESQELIYSAVNDNCLINADVSWGKTFTAIAIASKLRQKTLIITHTVFLRDQWFKEIEKTLSITPGIIGSGSLDYKNRSIVVSNVQTLRKHINTLRNEFGTVILDEAHHVPSRIFSECIDNMRSRFKIGLSATLERKDGLHVVLPSYFSKKVYKPKSENKMEPKVTMLQTSIPFQSNMRIPWANKVNELVDRPEYLDLVTSVAERYADLGHSVLVVSDRTEFLDRCNNRSSDRSVLVIGNTKNRDHLHKLLRNKERDIIYGSISIYKEGISEEYLSCIILATPINNDPMLKQLIGRIQRVQKDKLQPVVVDIILKGTTAKRQASYRGAYYIRQGYEVQHFNLT